MAPGFTCHFHGSVSSPHSATHEWRGDAALVRGGGDGDRVAPVHLSKPRPGAPVNKRCGPYALIERKGVKSMCGKKKC